jgi:Transposase
MQILYQRCAAIDIGKDIVAVAVRVPGEGPDGRKTIKRTFKTFYGVLRECARWLMGHGVTHVAMEATGIYSMPVYHALLAHGEFEVLVCNAGHVKNVPGRKTDLLTELPRGLRGGCVPGGVGLARFAARDWRCRTTAGFSGAGSAGAGCFGGHRRSISAVSAG